MNSLNFSVDFSYDTISLRGNASLEQFRVPAVLEMIEPAAFRAARKDTRWPLVMCCGFFSISNNLACAFTKVTDALKNCAWNPS